MYWFCNVHYVEKHGNNLNFDLADEGKLLSFQGFCEFCGYLDVEFVLQRLLFIMQPRKGRQQ